MHGEACKLLAYMKGPAKRFYIPVYQRNYDWKRENCAQLYKDLLKLLDQPGKNHFFVKLGRIPAQKYIYRDFKAYAEQRRLSRDFARSSGESLSLSFAENKAGDMHYTKIRDDFYVWTNNDTMSKIRVLRKLFEEYGENPGELVFYLRDNG